MIAVMVQCTLRHVMHRLHVSITRVHSRTIEKENDFVVSIGSRLNKAILTKSFKVNNELGCGATQNQV